MVKKKFDTALTTDELHQAEEIIQIASKQRVDVIVNVGTSVVESIDCVLIAKHYKNCYAAVGIHPNDATSNWQEDIKELKKILQHKAENKIVAIGECGFDKHYPDFNIARQKDVFKAQVELALEHNLPLIIHTRQAPDETLYALDEFSKESSLRGVIHCFSEDQPFANEVIAKKFLLGIGGTVTYPANNNLRAIVKATALTNIVLETDAPFLPIQPMRGKQNHPQYIANIAQYIGELRGESLELIEEQTTKNAIKLFQLPF